MTSTGAEQQREKPYHHGDLRASLVEAGLELARSEGPDGVVLREVTRRAGVTARAAYRHFADREALVDAVAAAALARMARVIERRQGEVADPHPLRRARSLLQAVGEGYIAFAVAEPGWFNTAFFALSTMEKATSPDAVGDSGQTPYGLLVEALAGLVEARALPRERLQPAAIACWSTVHGFATLAACGPLRELEPDQVATIARQLVSDQIEAVR